MELSCFAFVDNIPVGGGLSRFSYMLAKHIAEEFPDTNIKYLAHSLNLRRTPELNNMPNNVEVIELEYTRPPGKIKRFGDLLFSTVGIKREKVSESKELQPYLDNCRLAYFPSAHMIPFPKLNIPVAGTIHDFNWKYFFGRKIFSPDFVNRMESEIEKWMDHGLTVSSSYDVINEARKFYPDRSQYPKVIHIAPVTFSRSVSKDTSTQILKDLNIDYPYLIFPGNFFPHKNHLNLFTAFYHLQQKSEFKDYKLLLTGLGSEEVGFGIATNRGVQKVRDGNSGSYFNVLGLGYQPNATLDALISEAKLLVSPSIYEAICTPGMDAWQLGTPTAISDIPPFREHETVWGIKSAFFDPTDPHNIAKVIGDYLGNYDLAKRDGEISKANINRDSWNRVAKDYMSFFQESFKSSM